MLMNTESPGNGCGSDSKRLGIHMPRSLVHLLFNAVCLRTRRDEECEKLRV